jgi:phage shock protein C
MKTNKLYRSRTDRMIAGVCGGIAEHFSIDPAVVRLVAVALLIFTGFFPAFFAYLILWIVVPEQPKS